jgi:PPOX class probable F420-dependent enzyme
MSAIEPGSAVAALLETTPLAWLTTVRADSQPQSSYIWFHSDGTDLLIFSHPDAGKLRNIRANPKVGFNLDGDGLDGGRVVTMEATAEILDEPVAPERLAAYLTKYDDAIRNTLKTTAEKMLATYTASLRITPTRIRAW